VTFDVEVAARARTVRVTRPGGRCQVEVDARRHLVDAVRLASGGWSLLVGPAEAGHGGGRSYEVGVVERAAGELTVYVNGRAIPATVGGLLRRRRGAPAGEAGRGPQTVAAPMPGRVVKVFVKAGDTVAARQGLVVVEAMKMENELRASRAGTVREVRVAEGAPVEANAVLVVLDPP
jgi:biotin carboxyl carrier protein